MGVVSQFKPILLLLNRPLEPGCIFQRVLHNLFLRTLYPVVLEQWVCTNVYKNKTCCCIL